LVIKDLQWLKHTGLFAQLKTRTKEILGICGGYEMLFNAIHDPFCIENETPCVEEGLGWIDDVIVLHKEKTVHKGEYCIFGKKVQGFHIRHGRSEKYPLYYEKEHIKGTFVHGIFHDEAFKHYQNEHIQAFVATMRERLDVQRILRAL
jgi:adenosylcobyric acid synthase